MTERICGVTERSCGVTERGAAAACMSEELREGGWWLAA